MSLRSRGRVVLVAVSLMLFFGFYASVQPYPVSNDVGSVLEEDAGTPRVSAVTTSSSEIGNRKQNGLTYTGAAAGGAYVEGIHGSTLRLSEEEEQVVANRQEVRIASVDDVNRKGGRRDCPNRFLFVNTHTYGRHHNQLQEMINLVMWAKHLGRTAVLGWFRYDHKWTPSSEYYNFTRIMQSYCVITPEQLAERMASADASLPHSAACFGQKIDGTPLKRITRFRCRADASVPAHYNTRQGMRITREYFESKVEKATETLVVVGGQLGFFLRAGLVEAASVFGLLEPSNKIRALVDTYKLKVFSAARSSSYFGIHLRQREKECMKEVVESKEDGAAALSEMGEREWQIIATQCALTVAHVQSLMSSLNLLIDHQEMFLGSDHQNMVLERALVDKGAVMYTEQSGLTALAVDFFMLSEGKFFTGNQLSSITQNICFRRLGRRLDCHGFIPSFTRYHARNVVTGGSYIQEG